MKITAQTVTKQLTDAITDLATQTTQEFQASKQRQQLQDEQATRRIEQLSESMIAFQAASAASMGENHVMMQKMHAAIESITEQQVRFLSRVGGCREKRERFLRHIRPMGAGSSSGACSEQLRNPSECHRSNYDRLWCLRPGGSNTSLELLQAPDRRRSRIGRCNSLAPQWIWCPWTWRSRWGQRWIRRQDNHRLLQYDQGDPDQA